MSREVSVSSESFPKRIYYLSVAREELKNAGGVVISALGSATAKALTISEMLKAEGVCTQQRLITELVTRPLGEGKMSQKIRVEVHLRSTSSGVPIMAQPVVMHQGSHLEYSMMGPMMVGVPSHVGMPGGVPVYAYYPQQPQPQQQAYPAGLVGGGEYGRGPPRPEEWGSEDEGDEDEERSRRGSGSDQHIAPMPPGPPFGAGGGAPLRYSNSGQPRQSAPMGQDFRPLPPNRPSQGVQGGGLMSPKSQAQAAMASLSLNGHHKGPHPMPPPPLGHPMPPPMQAWPLQAPEGYGYGIGGQGQGAGQLRRNRDSREGRP